MVVAAVIVLPVAVALALVVEEWRALTSQAFAGVVALVAGVVAILGVVAPAGMVVAAVAALVGMSEAVAVMGSSAVAEVVAVDGRCWYWRWWECSRRQWRW